MDVTSEQALVERARHDPAAMGELFDLYYQPIFGYILRRVATVELAQDITSETFLKVVQKLDQFEWRGLPFSAWLYRIASNEIASYFRKHRYTTVELTEADPIASDSDPRAELLAAEAELERKQDFKRLQAAIVQLPIHYQEVITLRWFEHKSIDDIAQIVSKPAGTVKSLLSRGLDKLQASMVQPISNTNVIAVEGKDI